MSMKFQHQWQQQFSFAWQEHWRVLGVRDACECLWTRQRGRGWRSWRRCGRERCANVQLEHRARRPFTTWSRRWAVRGSHTSLPLLIPICFDETISTMSLKNLPAKNEQYGTKEYWCESPTEIY